MAYESKKIPLLGPLLGRPCEHGAPEGTLYDGLYGEAPPERGGFHLLKDINAREICLLGLWKGPKGLTDEFCGFIKSRKRFFFIDSYLKDSAWNT